MLGLIYIENIFFNKIVGEYIVYFSAWFNGYSFTMRNLILRSKIQKQDQSMVCRLLVHRGFGIPRLYAPILYHPGNK
jgi:hypothetical protein